MSVCEEAMDTSISMEVTLPDAVLDAALHHVANDQVDALKDDLATNPILIVASQFALEGAYQVSSLSLRELCNALSCTVNTSQAKHICIGLEYPDM